MNNLFRENKNSKQVGFTLVETIVYVVIFSFFIIAVTSFTSSLTTSRLYNQKGLEVNDQGAKVMKIITQTIRNANQINSPTITNSASNLSVATFVPATNPTVFSESGGVLYMTEGSGSPTALTNNKVVVSGLTFANLSRPDTPDIIKISFALSNNTASTSPGGSNSLTFNGSASLRK